MTYKEAEDKIIQAYFRDEIKPLDPSFCFCGTLDDNSSNWCDVSGSKGKYYSPKEYALMEKSLLTCLIDFGVEKIGPSTTPGNWTGEVKTQKRGFENALFKGMAKALDVLKQIHIDRGENIDPVPFKKRELSESRF